MQPQGPKKDYQETRMVTLQDDNPQNPGDIMADISLPRLAAGQCSLTDLLKGKTTLVVVFWSAVCSHCRRYDSYLKDFSTTHPSVGLAVIASRQGETAATLEQAARERELTFPILLDERQQVARAWLVEQTPRVFLLDAERRLLYRGAIDNFKYPESPDYEAYLEDALADTSGGRPISRAETSSFGCPVQSVYYELPKP